MVIDLIILGLVLFFAMIGAITGASRQVANVVGLAVGYFASRRLGPVTAPHLAEALGSPLFLGAIVGTVLVFICTWLAVRYALGALLLRILSTGQHNENRGLDRFLGFALGGAKMGIIAWVVLSAIAFFEQHVVIAGRRVGLSPKESLSIEVARRYNLFEMTQFAPVKNLVEVAKAASDPKRAGQLQDDPAYKALRKDARFQRLLKDPKLKQALARGDTAALLRHDGVLQLIQDPDVAARLGAAARASEREP
ncbi:CvpA family protein [Myxococcus sp. AM009]|uniref:CvpA family protein n=1 Tax=unclassified Myxococcus TaxID=2648731 RepID=UPI001595994A|nr:MULTISPECIES: CvpA family protein [unclassified Myxococcus]NVJ02388.1 CvpA family protein [Myxococcus sp. AM009]NVJ15027.1 CvpA family protein [Myxococcus sp. AM010]